MKDYCGRFYFAIDMNGDFAFTISDVWLMIKFFWLLPANMTMLLIESSYQLTGFFEATCASGSSWGGGIFSLFVWFVVLVGALQES